jgi:hypothetical protein
MNSKALFFVFPIELLTTSVKVEVFNFVGPIQFIFYALIELLITYFEGKEFMEL